MSTVSSEWKLSAVHQLFSLPKVLAFYIAKNPPSPEVYNKLIRCCKYFWLKNPVITLKEYHFQNHENYRESEIIYGNQIFKNFKIENYEEKLWIHRYLIVWDVGNQFLASSIIPRIYRCDLIHLRLGCQTLSFDEFRKFTSSGSLEILQFFKTTVKNVDGTMVPVEKWIELSPKLQKFYFENVSTEDGLHTITSETAEKLVAIPHFPKIKHFAMDGIPESFDFEAFFAIPKVRTSMFN